MVRAENMAGKDDTRHANTMVQRATITTDSCSEGTPPVPSLRGADLSREAADDFAVFRFGESLESLSSHIAQSAK